MRKKQASYEVSTFGSEFTAMKQALEYVRGLRYKLRMLGTQMEEPAFVFDGRNILDKQKLEAIGFVYSAIGS